jgi:hypothetical protein
MSDLLKGEYMTVLTQYSRIELLSHCHPTARVKQMRNLLGIKGILIRNQGKCVLKSHANFPPWIVLKFCLKILSIS